MSPKLVDKKKRARAIARAALDVFSQKGYAGTSMEEIARTFGVGKATLYESYPSKSALYTAAVMDFVAVYDATLATRLSTAESPLAGVFAFMAHSAEFCDKNNQRSVNMLFDILQQSIPDEGVFSQRRYLVREMMMGSRTMLVNVLKKGVDTGIFDPAIAQDIEHIATNLTAYMDGASLHSLITENYFDMSRELRYAMKTVARILLREPGAHDTEGMITKVLGEEK